MSSFHWETLLLCRYEVYVFLYTCGWGFSVPDFECGVVCCDLSDLLHLRDRNVEDLSGGELQRFACAVVCIQKADMFVSFVCVSSIFVTVVVGSGE